MTIVLAGASVLILLAMLEWGLRLRAHRGPVDHERRRFTPSPFLQQWWPCLIPGGLLLICIGVAVHAPSDGESIYTFGGVITVLGIRGAVAARSERKRRR